MSNLKQAVHQLQAKRRQTEHEIERIDEALKALSSLGGTKSKPGPKPGKKYKMSRAGRLAIARAKKAWWAKKKAAQKK